MTLETTSRDHQLADEIHQRVEPIEADADARAYPAGGGVARRPALRTARSRFDALGRAGEAFGSDDWIQALGSLHHRRLARRDGVRRGGGDLCDGRLDALLRRHLHARRADGRQGVEQRHRVLVGGGARIGAILTASHEKPQRIEAGEHGLDRGAIERALALTNLAEHVFDPVGEVADHSASDGVSSALERVDRAEQPGDLRFGRALAFQRDQRLRHRFEVLDGFRDEVFEDVRPVGKKPVQLGEPPRRFVTRHARRRRDQAREGFRDGLGVLDTRLADDVERCLEPEHHVGERPQRAAVGVGGRGGHSLDRLLHGGGQARDLWKSAESRRATKPVGHDHQMLDHRGRIRRRAERGEALLDGGEGIPRLHQEDTQEKLPIAVSHATRLQSIERLRGQLEAREARRERLGHPNHLVHRLARLENRLLGLDRHARDRLDRDRAALDASHLVLRRLRDLDGQRGGLLGDLTDLMQALAGLDRDLEAGFDFTGTLFHRDDRLLRLGLH
jgi:hypothetical protein